MKQKMKRYCKRHKRPLAVGIAVTLLVLVSVICLAHRTQVQLNTESIVLHRTPPEITHPTAAQQAQAALPTTLPQALALNSEVVAWLRIPNTAISTPVLQGKNNTKYLRRNLFGAYDQAGSVFADYECRFAQQKSQNLIVYGHMWEQSDNKGFSALRRYLEADTAYLRAHPYVEVEFVDGTLRQYRIVSAGIADVATDGICLTPDPAAEQLAEIAALTQQRNALPSVFAPEKDTAFLTLVTCTDKADERLLVVAVLEQTIRSNE